MLKLTLTMLPFVTFALAGCDDHDRQSLRDCAEATALEARLMKEYSEILSSKDLAIGPVHATAYSKALRAVFNWKESACPKVEEPAEKR
jgi:hypothetical protein